MIVTLARKLLIASLVVVALASAQTQVDLQHQARGIDFTASSYTKPIRMGSSLPATCAVGELYMLTSAPAGANLYACLQTNTWTVQGGSGAPATTATQLASTPTLCPGGQAPTGILANGSATGCTAYDAAGAATAAQTAAVATAEAFAGNASNLTSGTVPSGTLPVATASAAGAVKLASGQASNTLAAVATTGQSTSLADTASLAYLATTQTFTGNKTFTGTVNAAGAAHTLPILVVATAASLPATCTAGELAFVTGATGGQNIYECQPANSWNQQAVGGSGSLTIGTTSISGGPVPGDLIQIGTGGVITQSAPDVTFAAAPAMGAIVTVGSTATWPAATNLNGWAQTLTSSISTASCPTGMVNGKVYTVSLTQASSGGPYSYTWPSCFQNGPAMPQEAGAYINTAWTWNAAVSQFQCVNCNSTMHSIGSETSAPPSNPASGVIYGYLSSTNHRPEALNSLGKTFGMVQDNAGSAHQWFSANSGGVLTASQPGFSDLSGTAAASQLPAATASAQGAVQLASGQSGNVLAAVATSGVSTSLTDTANIAYVNTAQTMSGNKTFTGKVDASGATHTLPAIVVATQASLPSTCAVGELGFVTGATPGQQIYECSSTNTWTQQLNSGGGGGSLPSCAAGQGLYYASAGATASCLTLGSGLSLSGGTLSSSGGSFGGFPVNPQSSTYTTTTADFSSYKTITVASGTFTITLAASGSQPSNGQFIHILNTGSGTVTVAPNGQNLNGSTSSTNLAPGAGAFIVSDGSNYYGQVFQAAGSGGGSGVWSSLTSPAAVLGLNMGSYGTTFTWGAATSSANLFNLTDSASNTGTGYLLDVYTATGSTLKPFNVVAAGGTNPSITVIATGQVGIGGAASASYMLNVGPSGSNSVATNGLCFGQSANACFYSSISNAIATNATQLSFSGSGNIAAASTGNNLTFNSNPVTTIKYAHKFMTQAAMAGVTASSDSGVIQSYVTFSPASQSTMFAGFTSENIGSQSGTATGVMRAFWANDTTSGVYDYRSLETASPSGNYTRNLIGSSIIPNAQDVLFGAPTYSATSTSQTLSTATTVKITGAPSAGTNVTITNPYALWIAGGNARFDGHLVQGANNDIAGTITLSAATSASYIFSKAYNSAPACVISPASNPGSAAWWVTTSPSTVTANVSASSSITFNYICHGNPN